MSTRYLILFFWLAFESLSAQQLPLFTQYREHHSYVNPAAMSWGYFTYKYNFNIGVSHRAQWVDIEDPHPTIQHLRGEYIFKGKSNFSILTGLNVLKQDTDPFYRTGFYGRAVVLFTDNPYYFGIAAGFLVGGVNYRLKYQHLKTHAPEPVITFPTGQIEDLTDFRPDVGLGVFFYKQFRQSIFKGDNIYGGFSVPQMLALEAHSDNELVKTKQHFYAVLGYYKYFNEDSFLEPSVWVKNTPNAPTHLDFNIRLQYSNYFWVGTGFSTSESLLFEAGILVGENFKFNRMLKIGYSTQVFLNEAYRVDFGLVHEINLGLAMDLGKK